MMQFFRDNFNTFEFNPKFVLEANVKQFEKYASLEFFAWIINFFINNNKHVTHLSVKGNTMSFNEVLELLIVNIVGLGVILLW